MPCRSDEPYEDASALLDRAAEESCKLRSFILRNMTKAQIAQLMGADHELFHAVLETQRIHREQDRKRFIAECSNNRRAIERRISQIEELGGVPKEELLREQGAWRAKQERAEAGKLDDFLHTHDLF